MGCESQRARGGRSAATLVLAGLAVSLAACGGSGSDETLQPAAEPAESPAAQVKPAGKVVTIGAGAEGMAWASGTNSLALGLREPYRLAFVNPKSLKAEIAFPIPNPARHLAVSPSGNIVAVPSETANTVFEISKSKGLIDEVGAGEHPHDAAFANGKVFVANEFSDDISVLKGNLEMATLPAPVQPGGIAATGDQKYVAVVAVSERVLRAYDARADKPLGEAPAGVGPTHLVTDGDDAYVADTQGDLVRRFNIDATPTQTGSVPAKGTPYGIDIDRKRSRLWVSLTATNQLAGFSIGGPKIRRIATYPTIQQPNSVAVDPDSGDVFVASRITGQLERISPSVGKGK